MSIPVTLVPGTLPYNCYPDDPQTLNVDIVSRIQAFISVAFAGLYVSDTEPPADQRDKIWFNTISTQLYQYINGQWQRKYFPGANGGDLRMIEISADAYNAQEGGDASTVPVGDSVGPLWVAAPEYAGRVPVGVGLIPGSNPAATITTVGDTQDTLGQAGEYKHVLADNEGGVGAHVHPIGVCDPASDDGVFPIVGSSTVPGYAGHYIVGGGSQTNPPETTANLVSLKAGLDGQGVTTGGTTPANTLVGHNTMQPYKAVNFVRRSARIWVPAPF